MLICALLGACEAGPGRGGDRRLDIGGDTITLAPGTSVHDVAVRVRSGESEFDPSSTEIRTGDVVRFETEDSWTHAFEFQAIPEAARQLFESKAQLRSPPLLVEGATWVVSFDGAPAGAYRVVCTTHQTSGTITVRP